MNINVRMFFLMIFAFVIIQLVAKESFSIASDSSLYSFGGHSRKNYVVLKWRTKLETDTKGFNVLRKKGNRKYKKINRIMIHSKGNSKSRYIFVDKNTRKGKKYSYILEEVKKDGKKYDIGNGKIKVKRRGWSWWSWDN